MWAVPVVTRAKKEGLVINMEPILITCFIFFGGAQLSQYEFSKNGKTDYLPHVACRLGNGEQVEHHGIPEEFPNERNYDNGEDECKERRDEIDV
jgi:hypothetical protein